MKISHLPIEQIGTALSVLKSDGPVPIRRTNPADFDEPLTVIALDGQIELVDGFKRLRAMKIQGIAQVTVVVQPWDLKTAKSKMMLLNSRQRTINFYEEAVLVDDLSRTEGLSAENIAGRWGRSKVWVKRRLGFMRNLNEDLKPFVKTAEIGPMSAFQLSRLPAELQIPFFLAYTQQRLTVREIEGAVALILAVEPPQAQAIAKNPRAHLGQAEIHAVQHQANPDQMLVQQMDALTRVLCIRRKEISEGLVPMDEAGIRAIQAACQRLERELSLIKDSINERKNNNEDNAEPRTDATDCSSSSQQGPVSTADRQNSFDASQNSEEVALRGSTNDADTNTIGPTSFNPFETCPVHGQDRRTQRQGRRNCPQDLPDPSGRGVQRRANHSDRQSQGAAGEPCFPQGVCPVRDATRPGSADGLVGIYGQDRWTPHKDTPVLDDTRLQPIPVHGSVR